jgi:hypothetical protein
MSGFHQPGFIRRDDRLHPVAAPELAQNASHVGLDRRLTEEQPTSDVLVRQARGSEGEYLPFTRTQTSFLKTACSVRGIQASEMDRWD